MALIRDMWCAIRGHKMRYEIKDLELDITYAKQCACGKYQAHLTLDPQDLKRGAHWVIYRLP